MQVPLHLKWGEFNENGRIIRLSNQTCFRNHCHFNPLVKIAFIHGLLELKWIFKNGYSTLLLEVPRRDTICSLIEKELLNCLDLLETISQRLKLIFNLITFASYDVMEWLLLGIIFSFSNQIHCKLSKWLNAIFCICTSFLWSFGCNKSIIIFSISLTILIHSIFGIYALFYCG